MGRISEVLVLKWNMDRPDRITFPATLFERSSVLEVTMRNGPTTDITTFATLPHDCA